MKNCTSHFLYCYDQSQILGSEQVEENGSLEQLRSLYGRAQGLLSLYEGGTPKLIIPPLNYKLYRDSVEQIASTARLYDEDLKATLRQLQIMKVVLV